MKIFLLEVRFFDEEEPNKVFILPAKMVNLHF